MLEIILQGNSGIVFKQSSNSYTQIRHPKYQPPFNHHIIDNFCHRKFRGLVAEHLKQEFRQKCEEKHCANSSNKIGLRNTSSIPL